MTQASTGTFADHWLAAVRVTPGLTAGDKRVAEWLASNLDGDTTALGTWRQMRKELDLINHAAGVHLTTLARAGFVGERIRTGPAAGFPLTMPLPKVKAEPTVTSYKTRAEVEARNERRAAARRAADLRADAKWLAKK